MFVYHFRSEKKGYFLLFWPLTYQEATAQTLRRARERVRKGENNIEREGEIQEKSEKNLKEKNPRERKKCREKGASGSS